MKINKRVTTTDATATVLLTIDAGTTDAGIIAAHVVGQDAAGLVVSGAKIVRYKKVSGTVTLGTAADLLAVEADTGLTSATFAFAATANVITIKVTGTAAKTITWTASVEHTSI